MGLGNPKPNPNDELYVGECIFTHNDFFTVVDNFYNEIQIHESLKEPFSIIQDWPYHKEKLTQFWWTKFGGRPYGDFSFNLILKHYKAGFDKQYLSEWLFLFHKTIDKFLDEDQATLWKNLTTQMGEMLLLRNEIFKVNYERKNS